MSAQAPANSQEFPAEGPISAEIRLGSGSVSVTAEDRPYVVAHVNPGDQFPGSRQAAEQTEVTFNGDILRIQVPLTGRAFFRSGQVRIDLRVPLDSRLRVQSGSADVRTEGRLAEAVVQSGSGDVHVTEVTGLFRMETGSGDVRADVVGTLDVTTGSGDVTATTIASGGNLKTASGDVEISDARGPIRISTASGDVEVRAVSGDQVRINTASGDVEVGVPAGTRVWMDLSTVSGSTNSDLAMTDAPAEGAQLNLHVRTVSGDIQLRRVQPLAS